MPILEYSESTWQLVGVAKKHQLGTNERTQEKIEKIKQFAREAQVSSDDGAEVQDLRDALSVLQTRERELHQQLEEANRRVERERERAEVNSCISVANMFVVIYGSYHDCYIHSIRRVNRSRGTCIVYMMYSRLSLIWMGP